MKTYTEHVTCSKDDKSKLMDQCKKEFLRFHPEMKSMNLTQGFMFNKLVEYYLDNDR